MLHDKSQLENLSYEYKNVVFLRPDSDGDGRGLPLEIKNPAVTAKLYNKFRHEERRFIYGMVIYYSDALDAAASAGATEIIAEKLMQNRNNNRKLLNMGGGAGQTSKIYQHIGYDVTNADICIKKPDSHNIQIDFNESKQLSVPAEYFDVILCQEVIEHVENPWNIIRTAHRHLKTNGVFMLTTPNLHSILSRKIFKNSGYFLWFQEKDLAFHINPLPYWEVMMIAEKTGFALLEFDCNADWYFKHNDKNFDKKCERILENSEMLIFTFTKTTASQG